MQMGEVVGLNDHRRTRFPVVTRQSNRDDVALLHTQSLKSATESICSITSMLSASALMIAMSRSSCSRYPGALRSGTQIVTGFSPAAFIFSRCLRTRFATSAMMTSRSPLSLPTAKVGPGLDLRENLRLFRIILQRLALPADFFPVSGRVNIRNPDRHRPQAGRLHLFAMLA